MTSKAPAEIIRLRYKPEPKEPQVHSFWWKFPNVVSDEICQKIITHAENKWSGAKIQDDKNKSTQTNEIRKSEVAWINDQWLYNLVFDYMWAANRAANWNFKIQSAEDMQITRYQEGGYYHFHQDGDGLKPYHQPANKYLHGKTRKLSMTIVLNEDYEGGEFEFADDKTLIKEKKGTVLVFPSYQRHRVRPITSGVRYSLVVWFLGEPFK